MNNEIKKLPWVQKSLEIGEELCREVNTEYKELGIDIEKVKKWIIDIYSKTKLSPNPKKSAFVAAYIVFLREMENNELEAPDPKEKRGSEHIPYPCMHEFVTILGNYSIYSYFTKEVDRFLDRFGYSLKKRPYPKVNKIVEKDQKKPEPEPFSQKSIDKSKDKKSKKKNISNFKRMKMIERKMDFLEKAKEELKKFNEKR